MIEELRAQIDAVRNKLALAQQAGLSHETDLHRARLADLMDIAARHAIDIAAPGRTPAGARLGPARGEPASGTNGSPTLAGADVHLHADLTIHEQRRPGPHPLLIDHARPAIPERSDGPRRAPRTGALVYTRVNTIFGPKNRVEAGITQIEGPDRAAVEATSGNRGLTTMVNSEAATIIAISYWDEPDRSSEAELTRARQNAVAAAAGHLVAENYVLALDERASIPAPGAAVRLVQVQIPESRAATGLTYLRDEVLPQLRVATGFHQAQVLAEHECGHALLVTTWQDEDHAARADAILDRLRSDALHRAHLTLLNIESYTLVRDAADTRVTSRA